MKQIEYFSIREGFNPIKMLSSPMILVAIISLGSIILLPKIMDKSMYSFPWWGWVGWGFVLMCLACLVDPEFKAELEARQKETSSLTARHPMANFDMAGFLAGSSGLPGQTQAQAQSQGRGKKG
jgi:hypothetical protein